MLDRRRVQKRPDGKVMYVRLIAGGRVAVDKVVPPFLPVVLERRGSRYANFVQQTAVRMLGTRT